MIITLNVFSTELSLKQPVTLNLESPTLREVLGALKERHDGPWRRIMKDDHSLIEGCVILVNGRSASSLQDLETKIREGDEITFTVLVAGG
jgi:molybdopterin converting factor small subunit